MTIGAVKHAKRHLVMITSKVTAIIFKQANIMWAKLYMMMIPKHGVDTEKQWKEDVEDNTKE